MKIAVIGTGGIGGVTAACLSRAGFDVTPVARDANARAVMAEHGYRLIELDGSSWQTTVKRPPVATLAERMDAIVIATQAPALEAALEGARAAIGPDTLIVVFQNGLPEARAAAVLPDAHIVGCVVGWGASMVAPGEFKRTSTGGFQLGQLDGAGRRAPPAALNAFADAMRAVCKTERADNFPGVRWSKLAINSSTSTLGAIGGEALGKLLIHREVRRLCLEVFTEVRAVAAASGIEMAKVGGTLDIRRITIEPSERRGFHASLLVKHALMLAVGMKFRRMRSSMLYALERGRPPEIDYLNGELVRRGKALGVPTPVNAALVERVRAIEAGRTKSSVDGLIALAEQLT